MPAALINDQRRSRFVEVFVTALEAAAGLDGEFDDVLHSVTSISDMQESLPR
jgi:hypothetical protein